MSTWVFGAERWDNLIYYALGGHKDVIVACFFESSSLDVCPCVWSFSLARWHPRSQPRARPPPVDTGALPSYLGVFRKQRHLLAVPWASPLPALGAGCGGTGEAKAVGPPRVRWGLVSG